MFGYFLVCHLFTPTTEILGYEVLNGHLRDSKYHPRGFSMRGAWEFGNKGHKKWEPLGLMIWIGVVLPGVFVYPGLYLASYPRYENGHDSEGIEY